MPDFSPSKMRILGIIGDPVRHSLSPRMHNAALRKRKLPFIYLPFHVQPKDLQNFLKKKDWYGINVTVPHKEAVIPFLDRLSSTAKTIGAVNTVIRKGGKLYGDNTDAFGFLKALKQEMKFSPRRKKALVLGAGGAARAVLYALATSGVTSIVIANRTQEKAECMVNEFQKKFPRIPFHLSSLKKNDLQRFLPTADLVVNTTSVGLHGTRFSDFPFSFFKKKSLAVDLVYNPFPTPFLKEARKHGARIQSGLGMLLYQGVRSFEIWTKEKAPLTTMKRRLTNKATAY